VGATQDLGKALVTKRRSLGRDARLARVWWASSPAVALDLVGSIKLAPGATAEETEAQVRESAHRLSVTLAEHGPTLERARAALARLDHALKLAQSRGVLQQFNWRFKFLRQKQPQLYYGRARAKLKTEIARRLAASGGGLPDLGGIVDTVLPPPTK
jgi:hypothetical protein